VCRLFGQHAHPGFDPTEPLCSAENALRVQSHRHPHGWGIGWYERGSPRVRRGILPAHSDEAFAAAGREIRAPLVVAHVREASVGPVLPENCHPFHWDRWLFAHNGTVARFRDHHEVRAAIEAEVDPDLRGFRGDTDSERCFRLFLTRLRARAGLVAPDLDDVRRAFAEAAATVIRIADAVPVPKPTSLTFLVSDGRLLAACRHRRTLHVSAKAGPRCHAFVIASEQIGGGPWAEVPEEGFVGTEDGVSAYAAALAS